MPAIVETSESVLVSLEEANCADSIVKDEVGPVNDVRNKRLS